MPPNERAVCVVLHDVAPATWPACAKLLEAIDALGRVPVTLLVVPEYHGAPPVDRSPAFVRAIETRLARGDEVAMHGCFHLDDGPAPRTPADWLRRRVYTANEGEFAALDAATAAARLARGLAPFARLGWPVRGFVPPAWLLSTGARQALADFPFSYTSSQRRLYALPGWRACGTPSLSFSVRSAARRRLSMALNRALLLRLRDAPLLRLGLHPVDAGHPEVLAFWLRALRTSLASHTPATKSAWLSRVTERAGTCRPAARSPA